MKTLTNPAVGRTSRLIQSVPQDLPVALLIRHSARNDIANGETGIEVPLNDVGVHMCKELGCELVGRVRSVRSSPVLRCVQTAQLLAQAASSVSEVILDKFLGAPGAYVLDEQQAWVNWLARGNEGVIQHLVSGVGALPGMADPVKAANNLMMHMFDCIGGEPGLHLFVSHDSIVAPTVARALDQDLVKDQWPDYLDAAAFWQKQDDWWVAFREFSKVNLETLVASDGLS